MNTQNIWPFFIVGTLVGFAAIEGFALYTGQPTLSTWTRDLSASYPIVGPVLGLGMGLLLGHLWRW